MTYTPDTAYHAPTDDGEVCLYDHEDWPCLIERYKQQVLGKALMEIGSWHAGHPEVPVEHINELAKKIGKIK